MDEEAPDLGRRLRQTREARGLGQRELARRAGVTVSAVSEIESGVRPSPGVQILLRLARVLDVSADYLLGLDTDRDDSDPLAVAGAWAGT